MFALCGNSSPFKVKIHPALSEVAPVVGFFLGTGTIYNENPAFAGAVGGDRRPVAAVGVRAVFFIQII